MATGVCALSRAKLARYVEGLRESSSREKFTTGVRAGFVGSVVTPLRAVAGNASWGGMRAALLQPAEAGADYVLSVAKAARTGFTVAPGEFREVASALDVAGLRAMGRGFREGAGPITEALHAARGLRAGTPFGKRLRAFLDEAAARLDADPQAGRVLDDVQRVTYRSPVLQAATDAAFLAVEAADRPFWRLAYQGSLYAQAKLYGIKQGLSGAARDAEVARLLAAPTDEMIVRATDDALFATFKDKGALATIATGAKRAVKAVADRAPDTDASPYVRGAQAARQRGAQAADVLLELNVPFVGVPSAVAARSAGMSPLGLLSLLADATQAQRARTIAHASVGAGFLWLGAELWKVGRLTGPAPTDPRQRADERLAGRPAFAVKIGDTWVGVASLGPVAAPLFMGAAFAARAEEEPDASIANQVLAGAGATGRYFTSQTYLQGVQRIVDAAGDEKKLGAFVASQLPTPALAGQLERALDPYPREARSFGERLVDRVPGGNAALPRALGPFGEVPARMAAERVGAVLSPFPLSQDRDTPELAELRRLGVELGMPSRTLTVGGRRRELPREEYRAVVARFGEMAPALLRDVLGDPDFRALPDAEKRRTLQRLLTDLREAAADPARALLWDEGGEDDAP